MSKGGIKSIILALSLGMSSLTFAAEAPVEDLYAGANQEAMPSSFDDGSTAAVDSNEDSNSNATPAVAQGTEQPSNVVTQQYQQQDVATSQQQAIAGLTPEQRIARLEQQLANLQQSKAFSQLDSMQQQLQTLQGRLDEETHQLQTLQAQQRDLFQDLDERVTRLSSNKNNVVTAANTRSRNVSTTMKNTDRRAGDDAVVDDLPIENIGPIGQEQNLKKEQDVYENAFNHIKSKQYAQASNAMQGYLATYPDGKYAANAMYWLGELYLINGDNSNASKQFLSLVSQYPDEPKAADALLKLGYISYENGKWKQARTNFRKVMKEYPNTPSARMASQRLTQMSEEGH